MNLIGKKKIMNESQETFISSTMWTDRLGFIAANETLKKLNKFKINKKISNFGVKIKKGWLRLSAKHNLNISVFGIDAIPGFKFNYDENLKISTFFTQEMLKLGFLANTTLATCYSYNDNIIKKYLSNVDKVFRKIKLGIENNSINLDGSIKHSSFKRLTG